MGFDTSLLQENVKKHEQSSALRSLQSEEEVSVLPKVETFNGYDEVWLAFYSIITLYG